MLDRSRRRRLQTAGEIALLAAIASRREDPSRDPREVERLCPNRLGQALAFETADASIFERVASGRSIDAWQRGASAMAFAPKIAAKPAMAIQISKMPRKDRFSGCSTQIGLDRVSLPGGHRFAVRQAS